MCLSEKSPGVTPIKSVSTETPPGLPLCPCARSSGPCGNAAVPSKQRKPPISRCCSPHPGRSLGGFNTGHERLKQKTKAAREGVSERDRQKQPGGGREPLAEHSAACGPRRGRRTPLLLFHLPSRAGGVAAGAAHSLLCPLLTELRGPPRESGGRTRDPSLPRASEQPRPRVHGHLKLSAPFHLLKMMARLQCCS